MDFSFYQKWRTENLLETDGVIVGADQNQEWLLPWWWEHYRQFNTYPVTFIDFGLSLSMKEWCEKQGSRIRLLIPDFYILGKEELDTSTSQTWEKGWGQTFWDCRNAWFKKPLACLQSPYRRSIWFDLDCEIRCPLNALFHACEHPSHIAMVRDLLDPREYNSGVIAFKRGTPLIQDWAKDAFLRNGEFRGDQDLLSQLIIEQKIEIQEIPSRYNWSRRAEENPEALIIHWHGPHGKAIIAHEIQQKNLTSLYS